MIARIFVYGTLRPNQRRWRALEGYVDHTEAAKLDGFRLYSLPEGYPAIEPGDGEVIGALLHLEDGHAERAIEAADKIEGYDETNPDSLYDRVVLDVAGAPAYVYVYHPNRRDYLQTHGELIESGDWVNR